MAICVACGRGLCAESLDPSAPVSSCKGACVALARNHHEALARLVNRSQSSFDLVRTLLFLIPVFASIAAVLTLAVSLIEDRPAEGIVNAIAFGGVAALFFFLHRKWDRSDRERPAP